MTALFYTLTGPDTTRLIKAARVSVREDNALARQIRRASSIGDDLPAPAKTCPNASADTSGEAAAPRIFHPNKGDLCEPLSACGFEPPPISETKNPRAR